MPPVPVPFHDVWTVTTSEDDVTTAANLDTAIAAVRDFYSASEYGTVTISHDRH